MRRWHRAKELRVRVRLLDDKTGIQCYQTKKYLFAYKIWTTMTSFRPIFRRENSSKEKKNIRPPLKLKIHRTQAIFERGDGIDSRCFSGLGWRGSSTSGGFCAGSPQHSCRDYVKQHGGGYRKGGQAWRWYQMSLWMVKMNVEINTNRDENHVSIIISMILDEGGGRGKICWTTWL